MPETVATIEAATAPQGGDAEIAPMRYWHGDLSIYGPSLSQAQIDAILDALIAAVEAAGGFVGGGFAEVNATAEALK